jgi:putative aldouronate transport system permease protein
MKESAGDRIFKALVTFLVLMLAMACILPFINLAAVSVSEPEAVVMGRVKLLPVGFSAVAYKTIIDNGLLIRSLWFTISLTVLFVAVTLAMTILCAYPLSRPDLRLRRPLTLYIIFTMYFSGGMIPGFLLVNSLGLVDTVWALVLPGAVNTFNMILMRTYFASLPRALEESARIDGANDLQILTRIILPLSMPMIATIMLFYAISRWNGLTDAVLYINKPNMYPLQLRLRQLIALNQVNDLMSEVPDLSRMVVSESMKSACLIFSVVPILLVYPWLQRYFVKGVMIGSVKG